jgi:hypothetical protein
VGKSCYLTYNLKLRNQIHFMTKMDFLLWVWRHTYAVNMFRVVWSWSNCLKNYRFNFYIIYLKLLNLNMLIKCNGSEHASNINVECRKLDPTIWLHDDNHLDQCQFWLFFPINCSRQLQVFLKETNFSLFRIFFSV